MGQKSRSKNFEDFSYLKSTRFEKKTLAEAKLESFIEEKSKLFDDFFRYKMGILRYLPSFLLKKVFSFEQSFDGLSRKTTLKRFGKTLCTTEVCIEILETK